ncbi:hypothetical protein CL619_05070 [archaeon]|nr:hypothetical protein [archaeon]|tara:strand:- start:1570 stop:2052 length:483 start_codon:yes stop_codon:yes gene_type:complete
MTYFSLRSEESRYVPPGSVVETRSQGHGVAVIIHNRKMHAAFAGNFPDSNPEELESMIREAVTNFPDPEDVDIYVAGYCGSENPDNHDSNIDGRTAVPKLLREHGFFDSNMYVRWGEPSTSTHLQLDVDTSEGMLVVIREDQCSQRILYRGDVQNAPNLM